MSYSEKLQHPKWQKRRLEIITRDNCTCQYCSDQSTQLQIHHKYYQKGKEPWDYPDEALISACKHCHQCIGLLQERGLDPVVSVKLNNDFVPEFITVLMVGRTTEGETSVSVFSNPNVSSRMEYINTVMGVQIEQMSRLLDAAKKLV